MFFTLHSLLKHTGGSCLSVVVEAGATGSRTFTVIVGEEEATFTDDAYGTQQRSFEEQVSDRLEESTGHALAPTSLPAMGIKLDMFKQPGVSLLESLLHRSKAAATVPDGIMACSAFLEMDCEARPQTITGVSKRMTSILLELGYVVNNGEATLPAPDYTFMIEACHNVLFTFLSDTEASVLVTRGSLKPLDTSRGPTASAACAPAYDEATERETILALADKAIAFGTDACSEEDLKAFFRIDRNSPIARAEEAINSLSKSKSRNAFGCMQYTRSSITEFLETGLVATGAYQVTRKQLLWLLLSRKGGMLFEDGCVGPTTLRKTISI